jgi:glycolate oxidase FAD binding subunit
MVSVVPKTTEELAQALSEAAAASRTIRLGGCFSKDQMAGLAAEADVTVSTSALNRILQYEPRDLTISVGAGLRWRELVETLAGNDQMVPLDPPFSDSATVGGVIASNTSGPRRRLYGTARDVVIGMQFVTLEGKVVQSGGMVVKNVAGLDMGKLMIGSFGTLAAVAVVNFKLAPRPASTRTFILRFPALEGAMAERNRILEGVLQPAAIDLVNPAAASRLGLVGFCLLVQAGGSRAVLDRYAKEFRAAELVEGEAEERLWTRVREFTPSFLAEFPAGAVVRISATLQEMAEAVRSVPGPVVARAGNGVVYGYYDSAAEAELGRHKGVIEYAPPAKKKELELWPAPGPDFRIMQNIKRMFDPNGLLNPGRLYGRI